ncbi:hypothetical protein CKJ84_05060 [Corynebacterium sp. NML 120412]|nr:hypothetical protein CKJ84_05060 [Corynebacterium sp. NML 120412]
MSPPKHPSSVGGCFSCPVRFGAHGFARHAGHADIMREELDGAQAAELLAATEGWEPNEYVTPWAR